MFDTINYDEFAEMAKEQEEQEAVTAAFFDEVAGYDVISNEVVNTQPQGPQGPHLENRKDYDAAAEMWLASMGTLQGYRTIQHIDGIWYRWVGTHWQLIAKNEINNVIRPFFVPATVGDEGAKLTPDINWVSNVVAALEAMVSTTAIGDVGVSNWLGVVPAGYPPKADEYIPMANGLLHWPSRTLYWHTPAYWSLSSLPHSWRDGLGAPTGILQVLTSQFGNDQVAINAIQEMCGYIIVGAKWMEKAFALIGAPRSGKSTLADALAQAVGVGNAPSISMTDKSDFALSRLLGSRLVLMSDVRAARGNSKMTELVLNITGQDTVTIHRKYQTSVTTKIQANVLLHSNELPPFFDSSGAIASRFVLFEFAQSHLGKEDPTLKTRVANEIPEFISWALDGYARLLQRGYIQMPQSSAKLLDTLYESSSDIGRFLDQYGYQITGVETDQVLYDDIYHLYKEWSLDEGLAIVTKPKFSKNMFAYSSKIGKRKNAAMRSGKRVSAYTGLKKTF